MTYLPISLGARNASGGQIALLGKTGANRPHDLHAKIRFQTGSFLIMVNIIPADAAVGALACPKADIRPCRKCKVKFPKSRQEAGFAQKSAIRQDYKPNNPSAQPSLRGSEPATRTPRCQSIQMAWPPPRGSALGWTLWPRAASAFCVVAGMPGFDPDRAVVDRRRGGSRAPPAGPCRNPACW